MRQARDPSGESSRTTDRHVPLPAGAFTPDGTPPAHRVSTSATPVSSAAAGRIAAGFRMRSVVVALIHLVFCSSVYGQQPTTATLRIEVRHDDAPLPRVAAVVNGTTHTTADDGRVSVSVPAGSVEIVVAHDGFMPATATLTVAAGEQRDVVVTLQRQLTEEITVSATRTGKRLEDQPMRVEVLAREEIEEKMLMTPGDIVMMLNEMGGMRVQATSPSLGAASVRIQGMRGRYTRFLSDGLPLFGEQVGALGLLQIPPMDLGQVEVIKGVASSLYGAGAMGGVVNLISRRPGDRTRARIPDQPFDARRDRCGDVRRGALVEGVGADAARRRPLAGAHGRERRHVGRSAWLHARRVPPACVLGRRQRTHVLCDDGLHGRRPERRHHAGHGPAGGRHAVCRSAGHATARCGRRRSDADRAADTC